MLDGRFADGGVLCILVLYLFSKRLDHIYFWNFKILLNSS